MNNKEERLTYLIQKGVGKKCFVNCFELALKKRGALTGDDVRRCHADRKTLQRRADTIGMIFQAGWQWDTLKKCCVNTRHPESAREAARLYAKHCKAR